MGRPSDSNSSNSDSGNACFAWLLLALSLVCLPPQACRQTRDGISSRAHGAPAPLPKPRPPLHVVPGVYKLQWLSRCGYKMTLSKDHCYEAVSPAGTMRWYGSWSYCPKRRLFLISEALDDRDAHGRRVPHEFRTYVFHMRPGDGVAEGVCEMLPGGPGSGDHKWSISIEVRPWPKERKKP